jgi:hypothetical protein
MTLVKDIAFPNSPIISYEVDAARFDTEKVEGATGASFRNGRRIVPVWYCKITIQDLYGSTAIQAALAVKAAAEGQVYGFKFTCPYDATERDVSFSSDEWSWKVDVAATVPAQARVSISVELEEVIDGVPAP